jgi:hypothetical protein
MYAGIQQLVLSSHDGRVMFLVPMSKIFYVFILPVQLVLVAIEIPLLILQHDLGKTQFYMYVYLYAW